MINRGCVIIKKLRKDIKHIIKSNDRVLEIGPLTDPLTTGENVFYADVRSTDGVKEAYKNDDEVDIDSIVHIDYVIGKSYTETFKDVEKFKYIVLSHVIEHIPDIISYFLDISNILEDDGKIIMLIPDCRYTFDYYRNPSSFANMYDVYKNGKKSLLPVFLDAYSNKIIMNNSFKLWNSRKYLDLEKESNPQEVLDRLKNILNQEYPTTHYWTFTDFSFLKILQDLTIFNLFNFKVTEFYPTNYPKHEFGIILELDKDLVKSNEQTQKEYQNLHSLMNYALSYHKNQERFKYFILICVAINYFFKKLRISLNL